MTQQAIAILMEWATNHSTEKQEEFSVWLEKEINRNIENDMQITRIVMEAMIEEFELINK
jgi:uroporphyrinogen-III decarboxylase